MYGEVVVLTYQGPDIGAFTYKVPENLKNKIKIGQLVSVPFGKRNPQGIVTTISDKQKAVSNIKSISSIIFPQPILLPYQIDLLNWMAFYYHAPLVNCLKAMLPELPTKIESLTTNATAKNSFSRLALNVQQTLILVPSINRLPETLAKFPRVKNYALYHSELKTLEKFSVWLKIISGSVDFIFGSRSAIFVPCPHLAKIIIFDEHDNAYKDERSPYFDTLTCAEKIKSLTGAKTQIIDASPKITTYFTHKNEVQITSQAKPMMEIVSMQNERLIGNKSPISDSAAREIKKNYASKEKILLFLNKKKESGHLFCKNCHFQDFMQKPPEVCPKCQSPDIWFNSLNIASLASIIKGFIPKANINLISETNRPSYYPITLLPLIDIATSSVFYTPNFQKYDLVIHVFTDSLLNTADFSSPEKLFSQIADLEKLTKKKGTLILQTYSPESSIIKNAQNNDYSSFFRHQLTQRKTLLYPPFALFVKLKIKGVNREKISEKAKNLHEQLQVTSDKSLLTILGPYQSIFGQRIPSYNIILKYRLSDFSLEKKQKAMENLSDLLKRVPRDWQIIVEPESVN